jgi:molybdopterin-binding protein
MRYYQGELRVSAARRFGCKLAVSQLDGAPGCAGRTSTVNDMVQSEVLLTPREAAAEIGVSYATIKQWILAGKLKSTKTPGGHHRVPRSALQPLLIPAPAKPAIASRERFRNVSGRNQLVGRIVEVKFSGLLAKVVLSIGDQEITSIITADAAREMQLRKGQSAAALMKSTEVMIVRV